MDDTSFFIEDNLYKKYTNIHTNGGSQEKFEISTNGEKGILKFPQFPGSYDYFIEEFCHHLAVHLGISHCYQRQFSYHGRECIFSRYEVFTNKSIIAMEEFLGTSEPATPYHIYQKFQEAGLQEGYSKIVMFDVLTRQLDRNTGNLSLFQTPLSLYPLFDSGLSLFSTFEDSRIEAVIDRPNYQSRYGLSRDYFCSIPQEIRNEILEGFHLNFKEVLEKCYIPPAVTQHRLYCMEYWLQNMLSYMKKGAK